jgi:cell division protein ZapB
MLSLLPYHCTHHYPDQVIDQNAHNAYSCTTSSIVHVRSKMSIHMSTTDNFEEKLDRLIDLCQQLKAENKTLREREAGLVGERGQLMEKNELARQKIQTMINRLKSLSAEH